MRKFFGIFRKEARDALSLYEIFSFSFLTNEQEVRLVLLNGEYGGNAVALNRLYNTMAISATSMEVLAAVAVEIDKLHIGLRCIGSNEGPCDDEACVISKMGDAK